jgi:hypothetical protein
MSKNATDSIATPIEEEKDKLKPAVGTSAMKHGLEQVKDEGDEVDAKRIRTE